MQFQDSGTDMKAQFEDCQRSSQERHTQTQETITTLSNDVKDLVMTVRELELNRDVDRKAFRDVCEKISENLSKTDLKVQELEGRVSYIISKCKTILPPLLTFVVGAFGKDILDTDVFRAIIASIL